jgi:hypothetical protein
VSHLKKKIRPTKDLPCTPPIIKWSAPNTTLFSL